MLLLKFHGVAHPSGKTIIPNSNLFTRPSEAGPFDQTIDFPAISNKLSIEDPFKLYARSSSGLPVTLTVISGPATIDGYTVTLDGVEGTVEIRAEQAGDSYFNAAAPVTISFDVGKVNQTIDFPALEDKFPSDAPFTISATASSGLEVTFEIVSGPATIDDNEITLTGAVGDVVVRASQAGDGTFAPAPDVDQTFSVNQGSQTIDFTPIADKTTVDAPFTITATASSGLPVSFNVKSGPATIADNLVTLTGLAGTVVIEANQAGNEQYEAAPTVEQSFNVNKVAQTIDFQAIADHLPTDPPFELTATASSGLPVTLAIVSGPATIDGTTVTLTGAEGLVTVSANQAGDDTYLPADEVQQSFDVGKIDQTIDFPAISDKIASDAPFDISATASSGLTVTFSIISGPATVENSTITLTGAEGQVVVEANQAGDGDYNPAPSVQQSFNVNKLAQTIDFGGIADVLTTTAPFTISATASSGLTVTFEIVSGPATLNGNEITLDGTAGEVRVKASQAGDLTYLPAPDVEQTFNVGKTPQTIDFSSIEDKTPDVDPFTLNATSSSGLAVILEVISGPATIDGNVVTLTGAEGDVTIRASQPGGCYLFGGSKCRSILFCRQIEPNDRFS